MRTSSTWELAEGVKFPESRIDFNGHDANLNYARDPEARRDRRDKGNFRK